MGLQPPPRGPHPLAATAISLLTITAIAGGQSQPATRPADSAPADFHILQPDQWQRIEAATDRALVWLASQQQPDGSFQSHPRGQPAVTALGLLAFMSRGHLPGEGRYGPVLDRAVDFILSCAHPDGLLSLQHPASQPSLLLAQAAAYDHAISSLALAECYGMTSGATARRIRPALDKALALVLTHYPSPKRDRDDVGGWRYLRRSQNSDSDLSVTGWHLMFLRSCRNAGLNVPDAAVEQAADFVERCFDTREHFFWYALRGHERVHTRAMNGAGILALALIGRHQTRTARLAADRLLRFPFDRYRADVEPTDRFFYGAFYSSHAMFQVGGRHWADFYPVLARTLVDHQRSDGSWDPEGRDAEYTSTYSTALAVLALTPPYQLLPVFQR